MLELSGMQIDRATNIISMRGVGLRFQGGPEVFFDLNWDVARGSFVFLTGQSGAGKTSLLRLLYLACRPTQGKINVLDQDLHTLGGDAIPYYRRQIGFVFQNFALIPHLTALENVMFPLCVRGVNEVSARRKALDLLDWVEMTDHIDRLPHTLSGGQQQRIAVVRAIIAQPKLLFADEPTGNIDDRMAVKLLYLFEEIQKSGVTVVLATHNRHLAREFGHIEVLLQDKKAVLVRG